MQRYINDQKFNSLQLSSFLAKYSTYERVFRSLVLAVHLAQWIGEYGMEDGLGILHLLEIEEPPSRELNPGLCVSSSSALAVELFDHGIDKSLTPTPPSLTQAPILSILSL